MKAFLSLFIIILYCEMQFAQKTYVEFHNGVYEGREYTRSLHIVGSIYKFDSVHNFIFQIKSGIKYLDSINGHNKLTDQLSDYLGVICNVEVSQWHMLVLMFVNGWIYRNHQEAIFQYNRMDYPNRIKVALKSPCRYKEIEYSYILTTDGKPYYKDMILVDYFKEDSTYKGTISVGANDILLMPGQHLTDKQRAIFSKQ